MDGLLSCSQHAQTVGEDPIGTAGTYEEYFLLEVPLPWLGNPWASKGTPEGLKDHFEELEEAGRSFRAMAIVAEEEHSKEGHRTFIHYRLGQSDAPYFQRRAYQIPEEHLFTTVFDVSTGRPEKAAVYEIDEPNIREFFVCTHGSRDQCCGKKGFPIYQALKDAGHKVWRISHTGGHRFAPTCIDFPTGHYWAWLTQEMALHIAKRTAAPKDLEKHYRGWSTLLPLCQVAERAHFLEEGWASWEQTRSFTPNPTEKLVHIETEDASYRIEIAERPEILSRSKCRSDKLKAYLQYESGPLCVLESHE